MHGNDKIRRLKNGWAPDFEIALSWTKPDNISVLKSSINRMFRWKLLPLACLECQTFYIRLQELGKNTLKVF